MLRSVAIASAARLTAYGVTQTGLFQNLDLQRHDTQARTLARDVDFSGIVVVDVSEESIKSLEPEIGAWPYRRSVYAKVAEFLHQAGASAITFDIVFSEARPQDEDLAQILASVPGVTLAVLANTYTVTSNADTAALLEHLSWRKPAAAPAVQWQQFILPREIFVWNDKPLAGVGVIGVLPDQDGVFRRVPLLHQVGDKVLPGLSAATIFAGKRTTEIRFDEATQEIQIGGHTWPVDADGSVRLRFPSNPKSIDGLHFSEVFYAAMTMRPAAGIAEKIKGRKVFVGSTAESLNDYQNTLYGRYAGLHLLGQVSELLEQGEVLAPPKLQWDLLLLVLALLIPMASFRERENRSPLHYAGGFILSPVFIGGISSWLYLQKQSTALGFSLLTDFFALFSSSSADSGGSTTNANVWFMRSSPRKNRTNLKASLSPA